MSRFSHGGQGKRQKKKQCNADPKIPSKKSESRLVGRRESEKKKSRLEIFLSSHARSSQANILLLDSNAATDLDLHLQSQTVTKNGSASFKTRFFFSAKFPEAKGLSSQRVSNGKLAFKHALHLGDIVRSHARLPHERRRKTLACVFSRG